MLAKSQVAAQQENYVGTTFIPQNCIGWSMAFEIMLRNEWIKMASLASECTFYEFLCRANNLLSYRLLPVIHQNLPGVSKFLI